MLWTVVKTCPKEISVFGIGALILLFTKALMFNNILVVFPSANSLGVVIDGVLSSIVAAYLFFLISIQAPKVQEHWHINSTIVAKLAQDASAHMTGFLQFLKDNTTPDGQIVEILEKSEVNLDKVNQLFSAVKPNDSSSLTQSWENTSPLTFAQAMARYDELCMNHIEKIWRFVNYLDPWLIEFLHRIENSNHSLRMADFRTKFHDTQLNKENLAIYACSYFDYYQMA